MTRTITYYIAILLLCLTACSGDQLLTVSPALYEYAPVNKGHYVVYDVDSINYNFVQPSTQHIDTYHYQVKEMIADSFTDLQGQTAYKIEVYRRADSNTVWGLDRLWTTNRYSVRYEKVEDDLRFIKLTFPPITGNHWSGNHYLPSSDTTTDVYKTYAGWDYYYSEVNVPKTIGSLHIDSALTVNETNQENLVDKRHSIEQYGLHIGLIYKEWDVINKQDVSSGWDNPYKANGFRVRMRLNSYQR